MTVEKRRYRKGTSTLANPTGVLVRSAESNSEAILSRSIMRWREDRQQRIAEGKTSRIHESFVRRGGIDLFLWRGSKDPTLLQRFGAWIVGGFFAFGGVAFWFLFREEDPIALRVIPVVFVLLGAKIFRNGFSRKAGIG